MIFPVPSKLTPLIVLPVANAVAVAAFPVVDWLSVATYDAAIAVPCQTPVAIVPKLVMLVDTIPDASDVPDNAEPATVPPLLLAAWA